MRDVLSLLCTGHSHSEARLRRRTAAAPSTWTSCFLRVCGHTHSPFPTLTKRVHPLCTEYPERGPEVRFLTRVFHPQVGAGGETWLALTDAQHWRSTYGVAAVAEALLALLAAPAADGACVNAAAARMLDADEETFAAEAARWTAQYARRPF